MKKIFTLILISASFLSFAQLQGPTIEGTYLPVRGTSIKEVWETTQNALPIPHPGIDTTWDYSAHFVSPNDTFLIKTFDPNDIVEGHSFGSYFDSATHASFLRTPLQGDLSDSLFSYFIIDTAGVHSVGAFSIQAQYDSIITINPYELIIPFYAYYGMDTIYDTSKYIGYAKNYSGYAVKIKGTKIKKMYAYGYGTLKLPNGTFDSVLLAREDIKTVDSIFVDVFSNGNYTFVDPIPASPPVPNPIVSNNISYAFLRNNTFGSSYLMFVRANDINTISVSGWYSLPADCGSISGTVFENESESDVVKYGEAYLYRENSNFAKNDILATSDLDTLGNFKFENIPYGLYRIAIRPVLDSFPYALTTYYGDTTDWVGAPTINTFGDSISDGHKIHIQYHPVPSGSGIISGNLRLDLDIRSNKPIPGVDIIVQKKPGGNAFREVQTDMSGDYSVSNLDDGDYDIHVDIPGLHMSSTYDFEIIGGTVISCLNFTSGTDSIHPTCIPTGIKQYNSNNSNMLEVFPNPYSTFTTVKITLSEKANVLLEAYNLLGERLVIIDQSLKPSGSYSYSLNSENFNYSSGLYFLKLKTNEKVNVLKIIKE